MGNYHDLKPSDYDYPMSYAFRSYVEEQCTGKPLPPIDPPEREAQPLSEKPFSPRPIVNVTYKVNDVQTPAFKDLQEQIYLMKGRLTKYFERKPRGKY